LDRKFNNESYKNNWSSKIFEKMSSLVQPEPKDSYTIKAKNDEDIRIFVYEPKENKNKDEIILLTPDGFGFDRYDTHVFAFKLCQAISLTCIYADNFRGKPLINSCVAVDSKPVDIMSKFGELSKTAIEDSITIVEHLHSKNKNLKIGFIGFCFNGGTASKLSAIENLNIKSIVSCYGRVDNNDALNMKIPTFYIFGEDDNHLDGEYAKKLKDELEKKKRIITKIHC